MVLSAHPRAYANSGDNQLCDIPSDVVVQRAFALDTSRPLSYKGRYPSFLALPDRWVSWLAGAGPAGVRLVRKYRPEVIWSTYPIATAQPRPTLRDAGIDSIAPLDSKDEIMKAIMHFLARAGEAPLASAEQIRSHSCGARASVLASLLA